MDFWREGNPIGVTTNGYINKAGRAVMGRGIALSIKDSSPDADLDLAKHIQTHGNVPGYFRNNWWSLPVKHKWNQHADPELIRQSLITVYQTAPYTRLDFVRPGVGNGKLDWDSVVKPIVKETYDQYGTSFDVHVWSFR